MGAVLAGELDLEDALVELSEDDSPGYGKLEVLPAGPPPPNPVALISSQKMGFVLKELEQRADLVIIDTAAALAISDSIPLLQAASGVIMIVRMNRSASAAFRRMKKVVNSAQATVLGIVATGAETSTSYGGYATTTPAAAMATGTATEAVDGRMHSGVFGDAGRSQSTRASFVGDALSARRDRYAGWAIRAATICATAISGNALPSSIEALLSPHVCALSDRVCVGEQQVSAQRSASRRVIPPVISEARGVRRNLTCRAA